MSNIIVRNWKQVYKSMAVWLPVLALGALEIINGAMGLNLVPDAWVPVVAGVSSAIGWILNQNGTVIAIKSGRY